MKVKDHEHLMGKWWPQSRTKLHRACLHEDCGYSEIKDAPKNSEMSP